MPSFKTKLTGAATSPTGIDVPAKIIEALGTSKKPPVVVTINGGFTYRSTAMARGGTFMIPVSAERRNVAAVFAKNTTAKAAFEKLAYTHRKEHIRAVEDAKKPETRAARVTKMLEKLVPVSG